MAACSPSLSSLATTGSRLESLHLSASLLSTGRIEGLGKPLVRRIGVLCESQVAIRSASGPRFRLRALDDSKEALEESSSGSSEVLSHTGEFQAALSAGPSVILSIQRHFRPSIAIWVAGVAAVMIITVRMYVARKAKYKQRRGTVADLVRRGQLRSDSRGNTKVVKYEDPFNNPFVKPSKANSTVEICGKSYRLAPVTLTKEDQAIHKRRRSRAYQWKRPTVFLKEGDPIPPDVDPETVRWIPANHPFATTVSDIEEGLAQKNVYQKDGVPSRIRAEHEALQRKLEALQNDQQPDRFSVETGYAKDSDTQFNSNPKPDSSA